MKERPILFSNPMIRALRRKDNPKTQTRRVMKPQPIEVRPLGGLRWGLDSGLPARKGYKLNQASEMKDVIPYCPYGKIGDRLWVRETLRVVANWGTIHYAADNALLYDPEHYKVGFPYCDEAYAIVERWGDSYNANDAKLLPSIFMPRWASRITLEITDVRVQRVQDISEEDARAEGVEPLDSEREDHDFSICPRCGGTRLYTHLSMRGAQFDCDCTECDTCAKRFRHLWDSINGKTHPWADNDWVWALSFKVVAS